MPLLKVRRLDYDAPTAYAPPQADAVINTDDLSSAVQTEARGSGPFLLLTFKDGRTMTIVGTVEVLLKRVEKRTDSILAGQVMRKAEGAN